MILFGLSIFQLVVALCTIWMVQVHYNIAAFIICLVGMAASYAAGRAGNLCD